VVRRDQGGDTVSEGQGYGLLLAVAVDDRATFGRIWTWTAAHLQRPDGQLGYLWQGGALKDPTPAADADTQVAWALTIAAKQFHSSAYRQAALRLATAVISHDAGYDDHGQVTLAAGPWAVGPGKPITVEPGYWTPPAYQALAALTGDERWKHLTASDTTHLSQLTGNGTALPPDWALLSQGAPRATAAPDGSRPTQYGPDAMRSSVWSTCTAQGRALLSRTWPLLKGTADLAPLSRNLDGTPRERPRAPLSAVAAAGTAFAVHDMSAGDRLLALGTSLAARYPTYYGDAWVALGRILLTTRRLADCA
jgi:endo-1,4-beta-D-glucanase Y